MNKPNCHGCKFKKDIPGDCHVSCGRFDQAISKSPELELIGMMGGIHLGVEKELGLKASPHGVREGWCNFPFNYDPIWLEGECKGFQKKED